MGANKKNANLLSKEFNRSSEQYSSGMAELKNISENYANRYDWNMKDVGNLLANTPNIDLSKFSGDLTDISSQFGDVINNLSRSSNATTSGVNKYMGQGNERISSMVDEAFSGANDYLKQTKSLANSNLPGLNILQDQQGSNLASSIQQLKSLGGGNSGNISSLLVGDQANRSNLALESARYKTQAKQNLAGATLNASGVKAGALQNAANYSAGQAGMALNTGAYQQGIMEQQAGLLGKQANITNIKSQMAQTEFNQNELLPWMQNLQWSQNQALSNDPLALRSDVAGSMIGMGQAGVTGATQGMMQNNLAQQQLWIDIIGGVIQGGITAAAMI
ncbi:hypothetical protein JW865_09410 [Candidatus Bathyarchaeota archaeon]|nr:hypothetical protein [Candidatus Bathyarchaeota archaeon]